VSMISKQHDWNAVLHSRTGSCLSGHQQPILASLPCKKDFSAFVSMISKKTIGMQYCIAVQVRA
jgi:hypothetical protein